VSALPGYSNIRRLGSGGLGDVFYAVKDSTHTEVAIKVLRDWSDRSAAWQRAGREFNALRQLQNHPHVVNLEDVVVANGVPHLVMEFASGGAVSDLLASRAAPLAIGEVVLIASHTSAALAAAHSLGIHHLDIKPQNLLITRYGQVKVCDFGIAALTSSEQFRQQTNSITYRYASPEQIHELDAGTPSDVYSMGLSLVQLLVGPTWTRAGQDAAGPSPLAWPAPADARAAADRLNALLRASLQADPARRPSAAGFHAELDEIQGLLGPYRVRELPRVPPTLGPPIRPAASQLSGPRPPAPRTAPVGARQTATGSGTGPTAPGSRPSGQRPRSPGREQTTSGRRPRSTDPRRTRRRRSGHVGATLAATVLLGGVIAAGAVLIPRLADRDRQSTAAESPSAAEPTASLAGDDALTAMDALVVADAPTVEQLVGTWVPQVASGRPATTRGGNDPSASSIYARSSALRQQFGAVVFKTDEFIGPEPDMYVVVVPRTGSTPDQALGWCDENGLPANDCFARLVTRDATVSPVIVYQD
jgi:serine/threonine protein kinase